MRNYVEMAFCMAHVHLDFVGDVDVEFWEPDLESMKARVVAERASWEGAGWTFTVTNGPRPAYWRLTKAKFAKIIHDFAQVNNLISYSTNGSEIVDLESPRKKERRKFRLVKIPR